MNLQDLRNLVNQGESNSLEFKRKIAYPMKVIREVVAFANTSGGILLVGVNDEGNITGLKNPDGEAFVLKNAIQKNIKPFLKFRMEDIKVNTDRKVLAFHIPESRRKPHFIKENGMSECFIRIRDRSVKATREMIEILRKSRSRRGTYIEFGNLEKTLLEHLDIHGRLTLDDFVSTADLNRKDVSQSLVRLVLADVIQVEPGEGQDTYINNPNIE
jgi:predicted HTH transcriptional regulator